MLWLSPVESPFPVFPFETQEPQTMVWRLFASLPSSPTPHTHSAVKSLRRCCGTFKRWGNPRSNWYKTLSLSFLGLFVCCLFMLWGFHIVYFYHIFPSPDFSQTPPSSPHPHPALDIWNETASFFPVCSYHPAKGPHWNLCHSLWAFNFHNGELKNLAFFGHDLIHVFRYSNEKWTEWKVTHYRKPGPF